MVQSITIGKGWLSISLSAWGPRAGAQSCVALSFFCRVPPLSFIEFISVLLN